MSGGGFTLVFAPGPPASYLEALSRLRWRRAFSGASGLSGRLEIDDAWSVPAPGAAAGLADAAARFPDAGIVPCETLAFEPERRWTPPALSTLSQIERLPVAAPSAREISERPAASVARFLPDGGPSRWVVADGFRIVSMPRHFGSRPELGNLIPAGARRVLDVGCGAGELGADVRHRDPGIEWTGIEREPALARQARLGGAEVLEADAIDALAALSAAGRRFDAFVLADVLEHFEDPMALLGGCRRIASPAAAVVVSVPNAAFFRITEELVSGRFDPLGAGPLDAGHLRWFTRQSLCDFLEEASVSEILIRPVPAAEDASAFFAAVDGARIPARHEEIAPVQWLARGQFP